MVSGSCYHPPRNGGKSTIPGTQRKLRRPKLGQHFLRDEPYRARILEALALRADDLVIEIGPGRGAMTGLLRQRARKVIAIEIDRELAQKLQKEYEGESRVQIVPADVLKVELGALCRGEKVAQAYVFGNLPYYITSPILHRLWAQRAWIRAMGLMMQREVAERLTAAPGTRDYGYLTIAAQLYSLPRTAFAVPPGAFSPPPKVQSALVTFQMQGKMGHWPPATLHGFLEFVKRCFAQKRKNLLNNLAGFYPRGRIVRAFAPQGDPARLRAEQLSLEDLAGAFEDLHREA